jgi:predicted RNA-binding Zn-ribbon protein involved in translation (DUF1610 family)
MNDEKNAELCKDCGPTFAAFLEQMAARNKEQMAELNPQSVPCPTCGKVHVYSDSSTPKMGGRQAS